MIENSIDVASFKANCLNIIDEINNSKRSVVITKEGHPVARLSPAHCTKATTSVIGAMKGSVLRYDRPFDPVIDSLAWESLRPT